MVLVVTDRCTDVCLPSQQMGELEIHIVPLTVTLEGQTNRSHRG